MLDMDVAPSSELTAPPIQSLLLLRSPSRFQSPDYTADQCSHHTSGAKQRAWGPSGMRNTRLENGEKKDQTYQKTSTEEDAQCKPSARPRDDPAWNATNYHNRTEQCSGDPMDVDAD
jgi:hypothetical protein